MPSSKITKVSEPDAEDVKVPEEYVPNQVRTVFVAAAVLSAVIILVVVAVIVAPVFK